MSNIFAIGDLALVDEPATAIVAMAHAGYVAKTIKALSKKKKVVDYKPGPEMIFVPFGEYVDLHALMGVIGVCDIG